MWWRTYGSNDAVDYGHSVQSYRAVAAVRFGILFQAGAARKNPLMAPVKALERAKAGESQILEQAEQQKRMLEAAEK